MGYLQTAVDWLRPRRAGEDAVPPLPSRLPEHQPVAADARTLDPRLITLSLSQIIWGDGLIGPFDPALPDEATRDLALTKDSSVALLDAELGGFACALAQASGAWITAYETNPTLARYAGPIISRGSPAGRVELRITAPQPKSESQGPNSAKRGRGAAVQRRYDSVVTHQRLLRGERADALLDRVVPMLKPGAMVLIDDVVETGAVTDALLDRVRAAGLEVRARREGGHLLDEMAEPLRRLGILTRRIDDLAAIVGRAAANHLLTVATAASMVQAGLSSGRMASIRIVARLPTFVP